MTIAHNHFICTLCRATLLDSVELEIHIAIEHLSYLPYTCEHCSGNGARFPTDASLRRHYEKVHKQNDFYIRYHVNSELNLKRQDLDRLLAQSMGGFAIPENLQVEPQFMNHSHQGVSEESTGENIIQNFKDQSEASDYQSANGTITQEIDVDDYESTSPLDGTIKPEEIEIEAPLNFGDSSPHPLVEITNPILGRNAKPARPKAKDYKLLKCIECGEKVSNHLTSIYLHISTYHWTRPMIECRGCGKMWRTYNAKFKDHFQKFHQGLIKDNRPEEVKLMKKELDTYFPELKGEMKDKRSFL